MHDWFHDFYSVECYDVLGFLTGSSERAGSAALHPWWKEILVGTSPGCADVNNPQCL